MDCHVPGSRLQLLHAALGRARRAFPRPVAGRTLRGILKLPPTTRRAGGTGSPMALSASAGSRVPVRSLGSCPLMIHIESSPVFSLKMLLNMVRFESGLMKTKIPKSNQKSKQQPSTGSHRRGDVTAGTGRRCGLGLLLHSSKLPSDKAVDVTGRDLEHKQPQCDASHNLILAI